MSYNVKFTSYSGVSYLIAEDVDKDDARKAVRRRLKLARKQGNPVSKIGERQWEIESADDAHSIGDGEGFLTVRKYIPPHVRARRRRFVF